MRVPDEVPEWTWDLEKAGTNPKKLSCYPSFSTLCVVILIWKAVMQV
jgi:hypothetical protein